VLSFDVFFRWLWSRIRFVVEVILLVAAYLISWEPPAPVVSVSMSVVLRGAKKSELTPLLEAASQLRMLGLF
jgi:hypothetical protein